MSFLNHLRIRTRLLLAILVPVLLTAGVLSWITVSEIRANGQAELQRLEDRLIESRKRGLQDLVGAAKAVVLLTYALYAAMCGAGFVFVDRLVFETKGLKLEDVEGVMAEREERWAAEREEKERGA